MLAHLVKSSRVLRVEEAIASFWNVGGNAGGKVRHRWASREWRRNWRNLLVAIAAPTIASQCRKGRAAAIALPTEPANGQRSSYKRLHMCSTG